MVKGLTRPEVNNTMTSIEDIIRRAVDDSEFRALLLSSPEEALSGYELTDEDRESLSSLGEEFFKAEGLEERISRWGAHAGSGV
jgi:hypothetical protein